MKFVLDTDAVTKPLARLFSRNPDQLKALRRVHDEVAGRIAAAKEERQLKERIRDLINELDSLEDQR